MTNTFKTIVKYLDFFFFPACCLYFISHNMSGWKMAAGITLLSVWSIFATHPMWILHAPKFVQYWKFLAIRRHMRGAVSSPLLAYPFAIFLDLELPQVFKEKGLKASIEAIREWPEKQEKRFMRGLLEACRHNRDRNDGLPLVMEEGDFCPNVSDENPSSKLHYDGETDTLVCDKCGFRTEKSIRNFEKKHAKAG